MTKILLAGLFTAATAFGQFGQLISLGAVAGAPFTNVESSTTIDAISYLPKSPHFTVGGSFQLNLPLRLRLELDALYRPASFRVSDLAGDTSATEWRFPFLMQYRLNTAFKTLQPFVGVGASFQHLYLIGNAPASGPGSVATNSPAGLLLDGGVDLKLRLFRLSGELRFTRQFNDSIQDVSELNQAEVLIGAHF